MTEEDPTVAYNHYYRYVISSVGTEVPGVEIQVEDQEGNQVNQGQEGEICVRGPNIMKGYLNNLEGTCDEDKLKAYMKSHISSFKVPKKFLTVDDFPRSPAGKILKRELKKGFLE
jgi:acyl-CoA synthetase (AMP-forming)/AMP-acid ligase II